MRILVDEDIDSAAELFGPLGDLRLVRGRAVTPGDVRDADALIVRSVTRVDAALLDGSGVRFVGSATAGIDHVDAAWLAARGITFASAPGCNARAVAEYVVAAMLELGRRRGIVLGGRTLGVVGVGHVGTRVAEWGRLLGMNVLLCDPPRRRAEGGAPWCDSADLARNSDVVTLHLSLTHAGADATHDMADAAWLARLKRGAILINTSRGEVVREDALLRAMDAGRFDGVVLDVWRDEPDINAALIDRVELATPHVAGYTVEARRRAALRIRDALAEYLNAGALHPERALSGAVHSTGGDSVVSEHPATPATDAKSPAQRESVVADAVRGVFDIAEVDAAFRGAVRRSGVRDGFDSVRRSQRTRREFGAQRASSKGLDPAALHMLAGLGFAVAD